MNQQAVPQHSPTILVLEDDHDAAAMLEAVLSDAGYDVLAVQLGRDAMRALSERSFDLAIFDVNIPDFSGIEVLRELREHRLDLPVIFVSGETAIEYAIDALRFRAFDFLAKPFDPNKLLDLVERAISEHRRDAARLSHVTDLEAELYRLQHQAFHDSLTGLPNRDLLKDRLTQAVAQAQRKGCRVAVLFLDLDRFKPVNDLYGHEVGDRVLIAVARRLAATLRAADTLARLGGDEFVAVIPQLDSLDALEAVVEKFHLAMRRPFLVDGAQVQLGCSIGYAVFPDSGTDPDTLIEVADAAMYRQKSRSTL